VIIADTGFWLALANRKDADHARAATVLEGLKEGLVTTWPVLTETCHLMVSRLGVDSELRFLRSLAAGAAVVFELTANHLPRIESLMKDYEDLPMDLADACLVILAEETGSGRILTTDRRAFHTYRWKSHKPFKNLLE